MKRLKLLVTLASLGALCLAMAPVSLRAETVSLTLWHQEQPPRRVKRYQEVFDSFMKEYPNIKVTQHVQTWGEAYTKTMAAIRARKAPDLLFGIPEFTVNIKRSRAVQPVDEIVELLKGKYNIYNATLQPYHYEGHFWSVPLYGMNHLLYYRKSVFEAGGMDPEAPPKTWTELLSAIDRLRGAGVVQYGIGVPVSKSLAGDQFMYSLLVTNKAEHLFGERKDEIIFDNPRTVDTYKFWKKLYDTAPPGGLSWQWVEPQLALVNRQTAFGIILGGFLGHWEEQAKEKVEDLGAGFVPRPEDGQPGTIYYSNGVMLLTKDKKKREAAKTLIEYLYRPEVMGYFLNAQPGLFLPVTEEAAKANSFWEDPMVKKYAHIIKREIEQSKYGKLYGFTRDEVNPNIGRIAGQYLLAQVGQKMVIDGLSAEDAVKWGAEKMREAIK